MQKESKHKIGMVEAVTGGKKQVVKSSKQHVDTARNVVRKKVQESIRKK